MGDKYEAAFEQVVMAVSALLFAENTTSVHYNIVRAALEDRRVREIINDLREESR